MTGRRPERISEQIKEEVSLIIAGELNDPRLGFVTVTDARISPDLRHAKVFVSILGTQEEVNKSLEALRHASGFIRHELGVALRIKRVPELHFAFDDTLRAASRIEEILTEEGEKARQRELVQPDNQASDAASDSVESLGAKLNGRR
jgi:ribosome-binding factor A